MLGPRVRRLPHLPRLLPAGVPRDRATRRSRRWSPASTSCSSAPTTRCASSRPGARARARRHHARATTRPRGRARGDRPSADGGDRWLAAFEEAKDPWFWFSTGAGYSHQHRAWIDDLRLPFNAMRGYVDKLAGGRADRAAAGGDQGRARAGHRRVPRAARPRRRPRPSTLVRELARRSIRSSRTTTSTSSTGTTRSSGTRCASSARSSSTRGFLEDSEDVFYLHRYELHDALYDLCTGWATGTPARGPTYWPPEVAERKRIMHKLQAWVAAARPRHPAAGGHRAVHGDAVGRHHRHRQHVAGPGRRARTARCTASPRARASPRAPRA